MLSLDYISTNTVSENKVYSMIYKCKKCSYITKSLFFIRNHARRHHCRDPLTLFDCTKNNLENFTCGGCAVSTYKVVTFRQHLRNHHNVKEKLDGNSQRQSEYTLEVINEPHLAEDYYCKRFIENDLNKFEYLLEISKSELDHNLEHTAADSRWSQCDDASYKTQIKTDLEKHTFQQDTENLKKIELFKWKDILRNQMIREEVKWFNCDKCSFKTCSESSLQSHMLNGHSTPENSNWFICYHCSFKSERKANLQKHIFRKHMVPDTSEDIKWFYCDKCSNKYKYKASLSSHVIRQHTPSDEIKWFHCDYCRYKSKFKVTLQKHNLFKHTAPESLKWLQCDYCSYKGRMKIQLKRHVLLKHTAPENVKWFQCDHCSYKAKQKSDLRIHTFRKHLLPKNPMYI